jgi:hypothetical protein
MPNLYVALMHYPVVNKSGDIVAAAVTNLDLHDISRAAKTYGVKRFYVITPLTDQKALVNRLVHHWVRGAGARYNPKRGAAMQLIRIADSLDEVVNQIRRNCGGEPKTVVTSAKKKSRNISFGKLREMMRNATPYVLVFGTAWGLSESVLSAADYSLEPIHGSEAYNHLSVRSASAIVLDRLVGNR